MIGSLYLQCTLCLWQGSKHYRKWCIKLKATHSEALLSFVFFFLKERNIFLYLAWMLLALKLLFQMLQLKSKYFFYNDRKKQKMLRNVRGQMYVHCTCTWFIFSSETKEVKNFYQSQMFLISPIFFDIRKKPFPNM